MAIQFNCPFCTAPIRVPDAAGGKRGRCPKCKSKLRVPKPEIPAAPAAAAGDEPAPTIAPPGDADAVPSPPPGSPLGTPAAAATPSAPSTAAPASAGRPVSYARALKRRRSRRNLFWLPMLLGVLLVGGIAGWFFWQGQSQLEGTLTAVELINPNLEAKTLESSDISLEEEKFRQALKYLTEHPIRGLDSGQLMEHEVEVTPAGLTIQVFEPPGMRFFRVDIGKHAGLKKFYAENEKSLDKPRLKELEAAATAFIEECIAVADEGGSLSTAGLERFRRQVAINRLIGGLGYHAVAAVDKTAYLCVYEGKGALYFLLPAGTKRFRLKGRKFGDAEPRFPGEFTVDVTDVRKPDEEKTAGEPDPPEAKSPEPEKTEKKTPSEKTPAAEKTAGE